jgi:hypothetical protein
VRAPGSDGLCRYRANRAHRTPGAGCRTVASGPSSGSAGSCAALASTRLALNP